MAGGAAPALAAQIRASAAADGVRAGRGGPGTGADAAFPAAVEVPPGDARYLAFIPFRNPRAGDPGRFGGPKTGHVAFRAPGRPLPRCGTSCRDKKPCVPGSYATY